MIISHKKQFIMFLPYKTASQTMALRLKKYNESPYDRIFSFNPYLNRVIHQHMICADFVPLPESKLNYMAASFVRNPYDRCYSAFHQLQFGINVWPEASFSQPWIRDLVFKQVTEVRAQLEKADFKFDEWVALLGEEQIYETGRNTNFPLHPAHYWTHLGDKQYVAIIGRVENFEADFRDFLARVGIEQVEAANANVADLVGASATNPYGYRYADRMNSRSIDKINELFAKDFDLFGYEKLIPS